MEIVEEGDGTDSVGNVSTATAMITQDTPVLEPGDGVLDASPAPAMTAPRLVAEDPVASKGRRHELGNAAIATVGEDASVLLTACFDARSAIVRGIVSVAWTAGGDRNDAQIAPANEDLRVARPAIVLRPCGARVVAGRDERAVHDPGFASIARAMRVQEGGEARCHRRDDAVRGGFRECEARRELADGQVRAQGRARDQDTLPARA